MYLANFQFERQYNRFDYAPFQWNFENGKCAIFILVASSLPLICVCNVWNGMQNEFWNQISALPYGKRRPRNDIEDDILTSCLLGIWIDLQSNGKTSAIVLFLRAAISSVWQIYNIYLAMVRTRIGEWNTNQSRHRVHATLECRLLTLMSESNAGWLAIIARLCDKRILWWIILPFFYDDLSWSGKIRARAMPCRQSAREASWLFNSIKMWNLFFCNIIFRESTFTSSSGMPSAHTKKKNRRIELQTMKKICIAKQLCRKKFPRKQSKKLDSQTTSARSSQKQMTGQTKFFVFWKF